MSELQRLQDLLTYYRRERTDDQRDFYQRKARGYRAIDRRLRVAAGLLMLAVAPLSTLTSLFQGGEGEATRIVWGVVLAVIPALSTALLTARSINQYQSFQHLYQRTFLNLDRLADEYEPEAGDPNLAEKLRVYIEQIESAIANENVEWKAQSARVRPADAPVVGAEG